MQKKRFQKRFRNNLRTVLLASVMAVSLTACGKGVTSDSTTQAEAAYDSFEGASTFDTNAMDSGSYEIKEEAAGDTGQETASLVADTGRKLIKTVDMDVETQEYDQLMSVIDSKVTELGGYIESLNSYNGSIYYDYRPTRSASMTIRIPKDKLDTFVDTVSGIGNVTDRSEQVEDVTLTYVDLESHKAVLEAEQERLLQLLERAESIEDIITIEQRLSDVRYQLESMESQLRTFDNQVDYSTVYLNIEEVEVYTPVEEETVWESIVFGFCESVQDIGDSLVDFGVWFVIHIPYFLFWGLFIFVLVFIVTWILRRSKRLKKAEQEKKAALVQDTDAASHTEKKTEK